VGYKDVKRRVLLALIEGRYRIAHRASLDSKNVFYTGELDLEDLLLILMGSRGTEHRVTPHHRQPDIDVHVIVSGGWYIKFYFFEGAVDLLSVHRTEKS